MLQSTRRQVLAYPLKRLLWPNPAGRGSIAGCYVETSVAAATGRNRPEPDVLTCFTAQCPALI